MSLSRKSQKQINRLKGDAAELWAQQQKVLNQAGKVVEDAKKKLGEMSRTELQPRIDGAVQKVKPSIDQGMAYARATANVAGTKLTNTVLPALGASVATAVSLAQMAKNPTVRAALVRGELNTNTLTKSASKKFQKELKKQQKKQNKGGFGRVLLVGIGVVAVAGVAWTAWQALRADDDLWAEDFND